MANNTKQIRLVVNGGVELIITAPVAKIQAMKDLLVELDAPAICSNNFKLNKQQYDEFFSRSTFILNNWPTKNKKLGIEF